MSPSNSIKIFSPVDIPALYALTTSGQHSTEDAYFEQAILEQEAGKRVVFLLEDAGELAAYVHYNRFPKYTPFRRFEIPEIQDLFVHPMKRRQGLGAKLIAACEAQARADGHEEIGIGVGVMASFGSAQRLYTALGYRPDGAGVVFEREPVQEGEIRPLDDRLCLMLVKSLR